MKTPPPRQTPPLVASLLVAAPRPDQVALSKIIFGYPWPSCPSTHWNVKSCGTLRSALHHLEKNTTAVVICDCDLGQRAWIELLHRFGDSPQAASLIVTSRVADDHLWAEALNLGAYDVLAKPFNGAEVVRTLSFAWLHWANRNGCGLSGAAAPLLAAQARS